MLSKYRSKTQPAYQCWSTSCKLDHTNDVIGGNLTEMDLAERWCNTNLCCPYLVTVRTDIWLYCRFCEHFRLYKFGKFKLYPDVCVYCVKRAICKEPDCEFCFWMSMASLPCIEDRWCTTNPAPYTLSLNSQERVYAYCDVCEHISYVKGAQLSQYPWACKICDRGMCPAEDCELCFNKSCASVPEFVKMWSPKNTVSPREVMKLGHRLVIFTCCGLDVTTSPLVKSRANYKCPCCNQKTKLCFRPREECERCYLKSFACVPASKYYVGEKPACFIVPYSKNKGEFICEEGHHYTQAFECATAGNGCHSCQRKGAKKMTTLFQTTYGPENVVIEFKFPECKRVNYLPFDFLLFGKTICELDGGQHEYEIKYFKGTTLAERQETDRYKDKCAKEQGYHVVRVRWSDFYYRRNNCIENLLEVIEKLKGMTEPQYVKLYGGVEWF